MPQMMPLNWMMLMIYFTLIFILFSIFFYFNFKNFSSKLENNYKIKINWKW
uniref:ATP synthase F0 subunit 8 n=1 Tax=Thalassa montezumae TaxID=3129753 RepID=A0AAU7LK40_9CUCU